MESLFLSLYDYFQRSRKAFWILFIGIIVLLGVGVSTIHIEEDITRFFPDDERVEKLNYVFQNSKFSERLVFMVSAADSALSPDADLLIAYTEELIDSINHQLGGHISSIQGQVDDSRVLQVVQSIQQNLPLFLNDADYLKMDSLLSDSGISDRLENSYQQLVSPTGIITKHIITKDPVGISYLAMEKLQRLQIDNNVEMYDNYLVSKDHRHLIFFITLKYKPGETGKNLPLIDGLDKVINELSPTHPGLKASYFGGAAVAAGNARQLQRDTILTISIMLVLLAIFLFGFFKRKRIPFLILIPVVFGALFSLCFVNLIHGHISIIAVGAGSIILGIAINYSLHFLTHLKHVGDVRGVIKDLVKPMTLGSTTTVLAFLCLQFVNASVLQDLGLFAAFSLIGAALCSLIFLPQLIGNSLFDGSHSTSNLIERFSEIPFERSRILLIVILLGTPFFLYFAPKVSFNTDLSQLNFMKDDLRESQSRLESINKTSLSSVYIVSQATSLETALQINERTISKLRELESDQLVQRFSSVSDFIISDSLQRIRLERWSRYWTDEKRKSVIAAVRREGAAFSFSEKVYQNFETLLNTSYTVANDTVVKTIRRAFFDDFIIEKNGLSTVIALATIAPENKPAVYRELNESESHAFDRQMIANIFVEYVHADFNFIVTFTGLLVFMALLISYGRIELTLITFVPMLITWIWILGIMALFGIEFNIVNVMISTFIFGLGDDYSIFTMDGLQQEYQFKRKNIASIRSSIILSALTTISGLGVLIFAEHPALRSIAAISITGIVCVFVMSQTVEPFLFRWLITNRVERGLAPMTFFGICKTIYTYGFFVFGSFFLTIVGLLLKLIPGLKKEKRFFYHSLIRFFTRSLVLFAPQLQLNVEGLTSSTLKSSSIIISNHSSFLDILLTTGVYPKLILLTNKWVWNSPVFGGVVRLADYYPVMEGADDSADRVEQRVREGYSVVVFPEGTRSEDGSIGRFHKGAFFMAEKLNVPVLPLIIHGASDAIPKSTIYLNGGSLTLKFLPKIEPGDDRFGITYQERTKQISRYFKEEYNKVSIEKETPRYYRYKLESNYLYKGPVLEWYMRIKLRLEDYYMPFHRLIPQTASILDLGCGYGFLPYMLSFLSDDRIILAVDYDEEKIETAKHCYSKSGRVNFTTADITSFEFSRYDCIIIADVLHYLKPDVQTHVIVNSIASLNPGGRLIIREGNADLKERHKGTRLSELFSVNLLRFNKSVNELHFLSADVVNSIAAKFGCQVKIIDDAKFTSNVIFVVQKD
jgi:1-acyl-sn-glycerol-3-phosphate acyltransferase